MRKPWVNIYSHQHGMGGRPTPLMQAPALMVYPLLHTPLGYGLVKPLPAIMRTLGLMFLPVVFWWFKVAFTNTPPPENTGHGYLVAFALVCLAADLAVFARRARGLQEGEQIHTEEAGHSWLAWHTDLPHFVTERLIIPAGFAGVGWLVAHTFSLELGWWLVLTAASLLLMATVDARNYRNTLLIISDASIQTRTTGTRVDEHEQKARRYAGSPHGRGDGEQRDYADLA